MSVQRCRCRRLSRWVVAAAAAVAEGKRNVPPPIFQKFYRPGHNFVIWCWSCSPRLDTERNLTRRDSHAPRRPDAALPRDASDGSASVDALYPRRRRGHERRRIPCHGARPLRVHVVCLSRSAVLLAPLAARPRGASHAALSSRRWTAASGASTSCTGSAAARACGWVFYGTARGSTAAGADHGDGAEHLERHAHAARQGSAGRPPGPNPGAWWILLPLLSTISCARCRFSRCNVAPFACLRRPSAAT